MSKIFDQSVSIPAPVEEVFAWHRRKGALQRLTPSWETTELVEQTAGIEQVGARVTLRMKVGPIWQTWVAEHTEYEENHHFRDTQKQGPFSEWDHTHQFEAINEESSALRDKIHYRVPLGALGEAVAGGFVRRKIQQMFDYRHEMTKQDITAHKKAELSPMKILVTGASGLVGGSLVPFLTTGGHEVTTVGRSSSSRFGGEHIQWNPSRGELDASLLEGFDAVVHLAGAGIADGRWTEEAKRKILKSREESTTLLCETLASLKSPPKTLISASAIGIYGSDNNGTKSEDSPAGADFPAEVCKVWENSTIAAEKAGIRTVHLRIGVVLTPQGGALGKMLLPFKMGTGGPIGNGKQWMSWIGIHDLTDVILECIANEEYAGPVNAVSPHPVQQKEFARVLGKVLSRPAFLPLPRLAVKAMFGEMGEVLLLGGQKVLPEKLLQGGFSFRHPELEQALRMLLGKTSHR